MAIASVGLKYVALPPGCGRVIGMVVFDGELIVAFDNGVWRRAYISGDWVWAQVMAVPQ